MNPKIKEAYSGKGLTLKFDEPLSKHTTLRTGGPAAVYVEVKSAEDLFKAADTAKTGGFPLYVLGAGSNTLFGDNGFDGVVIRLKDTFGEIEFIEKGGGFLVMAGAGVALPLLVKKCADTEASGMEGMAGIPGTVGGALAMNAGTQNGYISDKLLNVTIMNLNGSTAELAKEQVSFDYRHSSLEGQLVMSAKFKLDKAPKDDIVRRITDNMIKRSQTQPLGTLNAGSIFKNPPGKSAGKLIDECGLKGYKSGGAQVSEKHANFIINNGTAKSGDILQVIEHVRNKVKDKFGIDLELELRVIA